MKVSSYLYINGNIEKSKNENFVDTNKCQLLIGFGEKKYLIENPSENK